MKQNKVSLEHTMVPGNIKVSFLSLSLSLSYLHIHKHTHKDVAFQKGIGANLKKHLTAKARII